MILLLKAETLILALKVRFAQICAGSARGAVIAARVASGSFKLTEKTKPVLPDRLFESTEISKLLRSDGYRNCNFTGSVAFEKEAAIAWLSTFDSNGDGGLALGHDDLWHDDTLGNIRSYIDE